MVYLLCKKLKKEVTVMNYTEVYYANNASKLRKMVDKIVQNFGGIYDKDMDDFYDVANETFVDVLNRYDGERDFDDFLYSCLLNKIKSHITHRNRQKRLADRMSISYDTPLSDDDELTLLDTLSSEFSLDRELEKNGVYKDEKIEKYLSGLPEISRKIIEMKMEDKPINEIKKTLGLSDKKYESYLSIARSYDRTKVLYEEKCIDIKKDLKMEDKNMETVVTTSSERTKNTSYAIAAITKKLAKHQLRDDHVLQRESGQWNNYFMSELISDILQGKSLTQIIISEEIKNGITMHWLIDGKQRCTNIFSYSKDGFAISKKVQRYMIEYQTEKRDEKGDICYNEDGFPITIKKEFDIRGKKFSQLPEELQDVFLEYQVPVMLNLNCTKKEIAYDIARFNRCRPMNKAQNGWTGLEEEYAEYVDNILKMEFFKEDCKKTSYTNSASKSGAMRRVVVESIFLINYYESFGKDFRKMCEHLSENANDQTFIEFYSLVERLNAVLEEEVAELFNQKDSHMWFKLFDLFTKLNLDDVKFVDFMKAFKAELHAKKVNDMSYDEFTNKSNKDRHVITKKVELVEKLMLDYLHIETEETLEFFEVDNENVNDFVDKFTTCDFVNSLNIKSENERQKLAVKCLAFMVDDKAITDRAIQDFVSNTEFGNDFLDDVMFNMDILNDWSLEVSGKSKIFTPMIIPALVEIVHFAIAREIDIEAQRWFVNYANSYNNTKGSAREVYDDMVNSLGEYMDKVA